MKRLKSKSKSQDVLTHPLCLLELEFVGGDANTHDNYDAGKLCKLQILGNDYLAIPNLYYYY